MFVRFGRFLSHPHDAGDEEKGTPTVNSTDEILTRFEAARPRLTSLAHRIVGSHHDAEDAVQSAWLRTQLADPAEINDPDGWFTTTTVRLCLDQLRRRRRRAEVLRPATESPGAGTAAELSGAAVAAELSGAAVAAELSGAAVAAEEEFLRREEVSRALLVLLDRLSPRQRAAYVLHDLFAVPFDQVADILGTSTDAAKKLAARARAAVRPADPPRRPDSADHLALVEAFLAAARDGDIERLVVLLAPDAVRTADARLLPRTAAATVRGARAVAAETRSFADRIACAAPIFADGEAAAVIAPGGQLFALVGFEFAAGSITRVRITVPEGRDVALALP